MKTIFISFLLVIFTLNGNSQKRIQIKNQRFELQGVCDGKIVKKETKDFYVNIDYVTGDFEAGVNLKNIRLFGDDLIPEDERDSNDDLGTITGNLPINKIEYSRQVDQNYKIELYIKNRDKDIPVIFNFMIKFIPNNNAGFYFFYISGTLNLKDLDIEELFGFEEEIKLIMDFQSYIIGGN